MENNLERSKGKQNKVWKILLIFASIVFLSIAASMIIIDQRYYPGILYLITAILYLSSAYLIATGRANIMKSPSNEKASLVLGFVILTLGLALNGIFWGVGFVLFLAGILSIRKNKD
ncbi:hypothetical protein [Methanococcoides sp. FTZ1]|uniref:hypothetical protein n=1 Tax=Methanococcoides sp. FTZ1 TaxID=3439061 RepID=UPI003F864872